MRALITRWFVAVVGFVPLACVAQNGPVPTSSPSQYVEGSLCTKPAEIVFSCPLANSGKIVSICASGNTAPHHFYYVFGKPNAIELTYPGAAEDRTQGFAQARLFFPGATGGRAYSFTSGSNYEYILYSVSGTGFDVAGVLVKRVGDLRATSDMKCESGKLMEHNDNSLQDEMDAWAHDRELESHGLPHVPRD